MEELKIIHERDVLTTEELSDKVIVTAIQSVIDKNWIRNVPYGLHRLKDMKKDALHMPFTLSPLLSYIFELEQPLYFKETTLPKHLEEEVSYWEKEHGYCVYISILFYTLMEKLEPKKVKSIAYYQGFSDIETSNPMARMIFGARQVGFHSWLTYDNKVLDLTAHQYVHSVKFDFDNPYNFLMGNLPEGFRLAGFKETAQTINQYQEMFANQAQLSVEEWIQRHLDGYKAFINSK